MEDADCNRLQKDAEYKNNRSPCKEDAANPEISYSEMHARLRTVEQALRQISRQLKAAQRSSDIALGGNSFVVVLGIPELYV